ncbi:GUN4 domain-containing protein [Nodosilinea sp. LEGE 07088]|uniref:GUN4 domain-containing protein n=1 Tax=Nodosilinea sp. LEGE 07088 TaxID=2777968 RepID=UPI00188190CA|nr:GUN4 domain-containing protein [Nodosilinea sp. LEGE 07088]MBE9137579.1 GUN4 domain-containing protein [Nodosilinea sp. LEGE 07088]
MAESVKFRITIVDPQFKSDDVVTEVRYLIEDLRDLEGMSQIRYEPVTEIRDIAEIRVGVQFEADSDRLSSILRRLRDRLYYNPTTTFIQIRIAAITLKIQTDSAEDLMSLMSATQSGELFAPNRDYLAEAETYSRTQGELSPTELDNLNLLRQRLGLSVEQAEVLNAKATGPFTSQAQKRRHFDEITQAEFSRLWAMVSDPPFALKDPDDDHWPVLQELAENLGVPMAEAETIYQKHQQRYRDDMSLKAQQVSAKTFESKQLAAEAKAEAARQEQAQQVQEQRDQYQALCHEVMANDLYPSEYDQGRLDQARRLRNISVDEAIAIETEVRDGLYGSIASAAGVDYNRLRHCLRQQAWEAADLETEIAILAALQQGQQPLIAATVSRLPAIDLATIDGLWSRYSNGKFGFKAQQQVYRSQQQIQPDEQKRWLDFLQVLGWRDEPTWFYRGFKPYRDLTFSLEAPQGHLPTWRWGCPSLSPRYSPSIEVVEVVMAHLNHSMPLEAAAVLAPTQTLMMGGLASAS